MDKVLCKEEKGQPKPISAISYTPQPLPSSLSVPIADPLLTVPLLTEIGLYRQALPPYVVLSTLHFRHDPHQDNTACLKNWNRYIEYLYHGDGGKGSRKAGILRLQDDQNNRRRQGTVLQPGDLLLNPPPSLPSDTLEIIYILPTQASPPLSLTTTLSSSSSSHTLPSVSSTSSTSSSSTSSSSSSSSTLDSSDPMTKLLDVQDVEALLPGIVNPIIVEEVRYAHSQLNDTLRATIREELAKQKQFITHHLPSTQPLSQPSFSSSATSSSSSSTTLSGHSRSRSEYEASNHPSSNDHESLMVRPQDVYEDHGTPLVDKNRLDKRRGPEYEHAINDVIQRIVQGQVRFPLKRTFIKPKELVKWFLELRNYSVRPRLNEPYELYGYFHENKKATCIVERTVLPSRFGGKINPHDTSLSSYPPFNNDPNLYSIDYSEAEMLIFGGKGHIIIPFDKTMQVQDTALVDFFTEEARVISRRKDESASIVELFRTPELAHKAVSKAINKYRELTPFSLRHGLFGHVSGPSLFKAQVALACYDLFGAQRVLDMCAGWGVHLMGALASPLVNRYQAFEPNTTLRLGHTSMIKVFNDKENGDFNVQYVPFEHGDVGTVPYDLIFTSPPYFDVEVYQSATQDDHNRQSIQSFPSLQAWLKGWLFPAMDKAYNALRVGGHMALYINDFEGLHMCRPMVNYAATMPDCRWLGIIGIEGETGKTRPLWVWRKGPMTKLCKLYKFVYPEAHEPVDEEEQEEVTGQEEGGSTAQNRNGGRNGPSLTMVTTTDETGERNVRRKVDDDAKEKNEEAGTEPTTITSSTINSNTEL